MTFIYLEMPKFNNKIEELETRFEKWLFKFKNLHKLDRIPEKLKENIFMQLFETAEVSKFTQQEYQEYEDSLKYYRDINNPLNTAREEGERKGKLEGKIEVAKNGLKEGCPIEMISKITGLTADEIESLKEE